MNKDKWFQISFVLSRVLNSGVIMSIEKNEKELQGLEKYTSKLTKKKFHSVFNSYTAAMHGALSGQGIEYGSTTKIDNISNQEEKFLNWLGIKYNEEMPAAFERISINWDNIDTIEPLIEEKFKSASTVLMDFTDLGFGPCAVMGTDQEIIWEKAERLKIFGAFDLKTMWTQEESNLELQPGIQFNYRISPLVAACVKLSLLRRGKNDEN